jgi:hypothetical protein
MTSLTQLHVSLAAFEHLLATAATRISAGNEERCCKRLVSMVVDIPL